MSTITQHSRQNTRLTWLACIVALRQWAERMEHNATTCANKRQQKRYIKLAKREAERVSRTIRGISAWAR